MERKPLVTIITVCYNAKCDLEKTICSVSGQKYGNKEYVVIDGGSSDGTLDVLKYNTSAIDYWKSEPDRGIYDAMNKGIGAAHGEWLVFMNAGDVFSDDEALVKMAASVGDGVRILRGNIIRVYGKMRVKSCGVTTQNPDLMDMFDNTFHHQACLIQKSLFDEFGLYSTEYKLCSDWKFFFDCVVLHHVKSQYVDITLAEFQMNGASSNGAQRYAAERNDYLTSLYGKEMFGLLEELSIYRKSGMVRKYYRLRKRMKDNLSPKAFNRLLMMKRIIQSMFSGKVN